MLDDGHGGRFGAQLTNQFIGRVRIIDIVVGERLALQLFRGRDAGAVFAGHIEGGLLVRVFAIAQGFLQLAADRGPVGRGVAELAGVPA